MPPLIGAGNDMSKGRWLLSNEANLPESGPIGPAQRPDGQLPRVIEREEGLLGPILVDDLAKIAFLVKQTHAHHRQTQTSAL